MATKPIVITGGTGGLGHAVVQRLIGDYACAVPYLAEHEWQALQAAHGTDRLWGAHVDLLDEAQVGQFVQAVHDRWGPIYGVITLAGGFAGGSVEETALADWHKQLDFNLSSAFGIIHAALPQIKQRGVGRIVTISSAAMLARPAGLAAYNVSKAGVQVLTESLANELKSTRITANTILPGSMATPAMLKSTPADQLVPLGYVADVIAFLLSDAAAGVHGASIPVTATGEPDA